MKTIIRNLAIGGMLAASLGATAQNTNSGYFLDNYTYRYQMNPAMGNDKGFVSFPGLGNLNIAARGNLHLKDVLYNVDGRTVLFTNPNITADQVLKNLSNNNRIGANVKENILSVGFNAFNGYNTISINARADVNAMVPKSLFSLVKEGITNRTYDIRDMRVSALGYGELALNHSRTIWGVPGVLRVGATIKALIPVAALDAYFNEAHLTLGENEWIAQTDAEIYANIRGFQFEQETNDAGKKYVSGANLDGDDNFGPNGFGLAFDLGATYQWNDFNFSLAVLDLGWMNLSKTRYASTNGLQTVNTDSYIFSANGEADNSFDNEWDNLRNDLDKLYQLEDKGDIGSRNHTMAATLNVGVDYALPMYKNLHFGFLSSTRLAGKYTWTEARFSANVNPVDCFSADVNVAFGTYGTSFGWLLNFHHTGFNFFVGMDHTLGKVSKQWVPLSSNASVNLGINFPF